MSGPIRFVRFEHDSGVAYGREGNGSVHVLEGGLFDSKETGTVLPLSEVKLLYPCTPVNMFCVGLNYRSHIGSRPAPVHPDVFYKPLGALQHPGGPVLIPPGATDLHYEGEMVLVIGKRTRNVSSDEAGSSIFGVTCGNDISEREWQHGPKHDRQWWRAKGSETFAPFGPAIVTGLNYANLKLETRLNGETVQSQFTSDLLFDCATMVSFISHYITLEQGDIIFTGTPGNTRPMKAGDVVEVELEGVGVLSNKIVASL
jgi:2-keto-4-pentenoate hydratase/2-oxohepta-3-ene-1,7-dioic acid hydratase in catechol pathway